MVLEIADQTVEAGQEVAIQILDREFKHIEGFQFTLLGRDLEILGTEPGALQVTPDNFGLNRSKAGILTASWNEVSPVTVTDGATLFTIMARATKDVKLSEVLALNNSVTVSEGYQNDAIINLELKANEALNGIDMHRFALLQNNPNPFNGETSIGFVLPNAGTATLRIIDVNGKEVYRESGSYTKGYHRLTIKRKDLQASGVYYYQLESGSDVAIKKLVVID